MAEIKNSESDMSTQQKAELDKEKRKEEKKEAKRAKRQHYRELNEPPKLTVLEEVGNAVTHGIGAGLAIAGFVLLPEVRHRAQSDGIVFLWNITDIDVSYELPVSLIQIRASSQAYLEKI